MGRYLQDQGRGVFTIISFYSVFVFLSVKVWGYVLQVWCSIMSFIEEMSFSERDLNKKKAKYEVYWTRKGIPGMWGRGIWQKVEDESEREKEANKAVKQSGENPVPLLLTCQNLSLGFHLSPAAVDDRAGNCLRRLGICVAFSCCRGNLES